MTYAFPRRFVLPLIVTVLLTVNLTKPLIHTIGRKFLATVFALLFLYFQPLIPPIDLSLIDIEPRRYLCRAVTVTKQLSAGFFEFNWIHIVSFLVSGKLYHTKYTNSTLSAHSCPMEQKRRSQRHFKGIVFNDQG